MNKDMVALVQALTAIERSPIAAHQLWSRCGDVLAVQFVLQRCIEQTRQHAGKGATDLTL